MKEGRNLEKRRIEECGGNDEKEEKQKRKIWKHENEGRVEGKKA